MASLPFFIAVYDTLNNQVYGADSWYWLGASKIPILLFNIFPIALYGLVISLFYRAEGTTGGKILLLAIFFSNVFVVRFLEFELDDFLMYALLFPIFAINPKKMVWPSLIVVLAYFIVHGWVGVSPFGIISYPQFIGVYAEATPNIWFTVLCFLPTIFLFALNNKWKFLIILVGLLCLFPIGKITNPLPLFVLPAFLSMTSDKTKTNYKIKFPKYLLLGFSIICVILVVSEAIREVGANLIAFQKCCDPVAKTCKNYNGEDWYFVYLGYTHLKEVKCTLKK